MIKERVKILMNIDPTIQKSVKDIYENATNLLGTLLTQMKAITPDINSLLSLRQNPSEGNLSTEKKTDLDTILICK